MVLLIWTSVESNAEQSEERVVVSLVRNYPQEEQVDAWTRVQRERSHGDGNGSKTGV